MEAAPRYMLDTNIASFIIRGPNDALRSRLRAVPLVSTCISSVTEGELRYGLAKKPTATTLREAALALFRHVRVLSWDSAAAEAYAPLRAGLEAAGTSLGNLDTLIAAHALSTRCVLVTNDRAFHRVPGLEVEDWIQA